MHRTALTLCLTALALAGCGSDGGGGGDADSALDEALGYLAEDSPLVITIDTDLDGEQFKALGSIADKFPFAGQFEDSLKEDIEGGGVDFDDDIKPLLGNEFVVGATSVSSLVDSAEDDEFVAAIQANDAGALEKAVKQQDAKESGEQNGATVYEDSDGDTFAIKDDVLVVAGTRELLDGALEQRESDDRLTEETFNEGLEGLPEQALIKVYGDIGALIESDPSTEQARKVKWVNAIETLGLTASVKEDEVAIDFDLSTNGDDLEDGDLPLAAGGKAPGVVRREGEIGVALRDLNQIFQFGQDAGQAVDPSGFSDFATAKKQIESQLGVSVDDDIFGQLTGDVSLSLGVEGNFGLRAEPKDPAALAETLDKAKLALSGAFESLLGGPAEIRGPDGDGLYIASSGGEAIAFGVVGDAFVVTDRPASAKELASAEPGSVEGAKGSLVVNADAEALADQVLSQQDGLLGLGGSLFTGALGDLSGSVESSTDGLRGSLTLGID